MNQLKNIDYRSWVKAALIVGLMLFCFDAFAATGNIGGNGGTQTVTPPSNFNNLTTNVKTLERDILGFVQIVVTLAGILMCFRGVVHLKQNASGSPQEKHLSKGLASLVFAAILFIVVPLLHMFVGTLGANVGGAKNSINNWDAGGMNHGGAISAPAKSGG